MIIGHENIQNFLEQAAKKERVSHAYLIVGPARVGKSAVAKWFIAKLLGITEEKLATYPDFYEVRRETDEDGELRNTINIEQIRALRTRLGLSSFLNNWKVALIYDAESLTPEAANALLKTLEEPRARVCLMLLSTHINNLPQTIVSRTEVLRANPVPTPEIYKSLLVLGARHDEALDLARLSAGLPGIALELFKNKDERAEWQEAVSAFYSFAGTPVALRLAAAREFAKNENLGELFDKWIFALRNKLFLYYNCKELAFEDATPKTLRLLPSADELGSKGACPPLSEICPWRKMPPNDPNDPNDPKQGTQLWQSLEQILEAKHLLRINVNKNLLLENILINL